MLDKLEDELEAIIKSTKSLIKFSYFNDSETGSNKYRNNCKVSYNNCFSHRDAVQQTSGPGDQGGLTT